MNNSDCAFLECWLHFDPSDKFGKAYFEPCQTSTMKLSPKIVKPLSTNFTKYSNTPKQFAGGQTHANNSSANCRHSNNSSANCRHIV